MLAIQRSKDEAERCTPNFLPCKVNYDGPINAKERYWKPDQDQDGKHKSFFRGRELHGREVKVPEGYKGSVLQITDNVIPNKMQIAAEDDDEEEQEAPETKAVEELATFDEVMVWGHEAIADSTEDPYVKGIEEWMSFAAAMHSNEGDTTKTS